MCETLNMCTIDSHKAVKDDPIAWDSLKYLGIQETGEEYWLELRNCLCGSTLAKRICQVHGQESP